MRLDIAVDARAVGVEDLRLALRQAAERRARGPAHAREPDEIIQVGESPAAKLGRDAPGQRAVAENLRHAAADGAAVEIHLPQALPGVQGSLREKKVALARC